VLHPLPSLSRMLSSSAVEVIPRREDRCQANDTPPQQSHTERNQLVVTLWLLKDKDDSKQMTHFPISRLLDMIGNGGG
jgi:hypothetical protein